MKMRRGQCDGGAIVAALTLVVAVVAALPASVASDLPVTNGLVLHLDASDPLDNDGASLPGDGTCPDTWYDTSSAQNDTDAKESAPTWHADGGAAWSNHPVFRFDGDDGYRIGTSPYTSDPLGVHGRANVTIITVVNPQGNTVGNNDRWFGQTTAFAFGFQGNSAGDVSAVCHNSADIEEGIVSIRTTVDKSSDTLVIASRHSRFLRDIYINGRINNSNTNDWGAGTTIETAAPKGVGAFANTGSSALGNFYSGDMAEVIVYDRSLSTNELDQVASHLMDKYGITALGAPAGSELPVTSGLVLHMNASDPLDNGGSVLPTDGSTPQNWYDTSGELNDSDAFESDPAWIADGGAVWNNKPIFRFDGNDGYRIGNTPYTSDPLGVHGGTNVTIITVINPQGNTVGNNNRWFGQTTAFAFGHQGAGSPAGAVHSACHNSSNLYEGIGGSMVISGSNATFIVVSRHSRFLRDLYINAALENSDTNDWGAGTTIETAAPKGVGAFANTGSSALSLFFSGDIAEILVYDRLLTDEEHNEVGYSMQAKYNVDSVYTPPSVGTVFLLR